MTKRKKRAFIIGLVIIGCGGLFITVVSLGSPDVSWWAQISGAAPAIQPPFLGFSYFPNFGELGTSGDYARTPVSWSAFQPERNGPFAWNNNQTQILSRLREAGKKVIPIFRSTGKNTRSQDAVTVCSAAPSDLEEKWNTTYGHSKSYYAFVKEFALRHKGEFDIVVVENEMHDSKFWCSNSSMDDYIRVLKTVKKAFRDIELVPSKPVVKIADGGIQGGTLALMTLEDFILSGKNTLAVSFYTKMTGATLTFEDVVKQLEWWKKQPIPANAWYLINNAKLYSYVDFVNFHHYQPTATLSETMAFLKKKTDNKKRIFSNEIGRMLDKTSHPDEKERISEGAKEMLRKIVILLWHKVRPVVWYSGPARADHINAAAFFEPVTGTSDESPDEMFEGIRISKTMKTYRTAMKFLNRTLITAQTQSPHNNKTIFRYVFDFGAETVAVTWGIGAKSDPVTTNLACHVYLYTGEEAISDKDKKLSVDPVYVVCPK